MTDTLLPKNDEKFYEQIVEQVSDAHEKNQNLDKYQRMVGKKSQVLVSADRIMQLIKDRDTKMLEQARKDGYLDGVQSDKRSTDEVITRSTIQALKDIGMYAVDCTVGRNWEGSHVKKAIPVESIASRITYYESELSKLTIERRNLNEQHTST